MTSPERQGWSSQELFEVGKRQRQILLMILITFVAMFVPFATIVTGIIQIFFIFKLAEAVRSSAAWLYIILAFIPLVGLVGLLVLNQRATRILQTHGLKVGLLGVRSADLNRLQKTA